MYPCGTANSSGAQYFIEFKDIQSAERACKIHADNVFVLPMSREFIEEYRNIVKSIGHGASHVQSNATTGATRLRSSSSYLSTLSMSGMDTGPEVSSSTRNPPNDKRSHRRSRSRLQAKEVDAMSIDCTRALSSAPASFVVPPHQIPSPAQVSSFLDALKSSNPSLLARLHDRHEKENVVPEAPLVNHSLSSMPPSASRPPVPVVPVNDHEPLDRPLNIVSGPSFTLDNGLVMTLCGEQIHYNLESLEENPNSIIDLLKATLSERDKWIIVACHYRRKGNFESAITVMMSMIEGRFLIAN